ISGKDVVFLGDTALIFTENSLFLPQRQDPPGPMLGMPFPQAHRLLPDRRTLITVLPVSAGEKPRKAPSTYIRTYNLDTLRMTRVVDLPLQAEDAVAISPDGKTLAACRTDGKETRVRMFDTSTGEERAENQGHNAAITALAWSADGQKL